MITSDDLHALAVYMVENHGNRALGLAEMAVDELEAQNARESADAWRALRSVVADMLAGRLSTVVRPSVH